MPDRSTSPHQLLHTIRFAREPDNPDLIQHWLNQDPALNETHSDTCWRVRRLQYHLLFNTIKDAQLPLRWRCACLEAIYSLLNWMDTLANDIAEKREVRRLHFEVTMLQRCCLPKSSLH